MTEDESQEQPLPSELEESIEGFEPAGFPSQHHGPAWLAPLPRGTRIHVRYFRKPQDNFIAGRAWFGPGTEGPPGHAHGGSMASLLDEAMGLATFYLGKPALARNIDVSFDKPLPIETTVRFEAWIEKTEGRKVFAQSQLFRSDGEVACRATGLFLQLNPDNLEPFVKALGKLQKEVTGEDDS